VRTILNRAAVLVGVEGETKMARNASSIRSILDVRVLLNRALLVVELGIKHGLGTL
jgi:hypothetical protein